MPSNTVMVFAGVCTLLQAIGQTVFTSLGIAQYFCVIDFLRGLPLLLYIKILYFHNPGVCGSRVEFGNAIESITNPAFVLQTSLPFTAFRTFVINCIGLGLAVIWIVTSGMMMRGGAKDKQTKCVRWPWIIATVLVIGLNLVAAITYANDSFHTRTLNDIIDFIGGVLSGVGNVQLDTAWAAWTMVLVYSGGVLLFVLNIILVIVVILDYKSKSDAGVDVARVEDPVPVAAPQVPTTPLPAPSPAPQLVSTAIQASGIASASVQTHSTPPVHRQSSTSDLEEDITSLPSESRFTTRIPRAGLSRSFRRMKAFLFRKSSSSPDVHKKTETSVPQTATFNSFIREVPRRANESLEASPERSPYAHHEDDKKRTVNFPQSLMSLPQRLENIMAEQQRRLDRAVVDTAGRSSPPRASQSMPHLATNTTTANQTEPAGLNRGRRGTTAELQGQLPWAYIPAPAHRMRDQLPSDEDLPPVPLPDYTAIQADRKASVHRAASSLSSLLKRDFVSTTTPKPRRSPFNQSDVLY